MSTCYLISVTCSVPSFFGIVFRFVFVFLFVLSCVLFAGESLYTTLRPKGRSDGATLNIKYDTSERFIMHLREHQQLEERHIIAIRCMYFSTFLDFFCVDDRNHPRSKQF